MRAGGEIFSESKNFFGQVLWYSLKLLAEKTCPIRCEVCTLEKVTQKQRVRLLNRFVNSVTLNGSTSSHMCEVMWVTMMRQ